MSADRKLTLYAIPGLGTDERIFQHLDLDCDLVVLPWKIPSSTDNLRSFAQTLVSEIELQEPYGFLGVSFGGMLITELHHLYNPELSFAISSVTHEVEMPFWLRNLRYNPFLWSLPSSFFKPPFDWVKHSLGITNKRHQALFRSFYDAADPQFLKRSIQLICNWKAPRELKPGLVKIHGKQDKLFDVEKLIKPHYTLVGSHFLIISGAKRISEIINQEIKAETLADHTP
ncbi:MAG: hypothetical protein ACPF8V_04445 [Luteibaculum sp.]